MILLHSNSASRGNRGSDHPFNEALQTGCIRAIGFAKVSIVVQYLSTATGVSPFELLVNSAVPLVLIAAILLAKPGRKFPWYLLVIWVVVDAIGLVYFWYDK